MDDKQKALDRAILSIEKQYGKGSIMKLGETGTRLNIGTIPTGSLSLDIALGVGGVFLGGAGCGDLRSRIIRENHVSSPYYG